MWNYRFQCSSASRKFLNRYCVKHQRAHSRVSVLFSEPKIPQLTIIRIRCIRSHLFQCSSASRKFLNCFGFRSSSSASLMVSVLFSEPKIPQFFENFLDGESICEFQCSSASRKFLNGISAISPPPFCRVSVLFSEPKIPQSRPSHLRPSIFPTAMITLRHS